MIDITACHAAADRSAAEFLRDRLDRASEARLWLEELKPGETLADIWDRGSGSTAILLLLSPDSVPSDASRESWAEVLEHVEHNEAPPLATVTQRECRVPPLLRRKHAFHIDRPREIQQWAIALHEVEAPSFAAAPCACDAAALEALDGLRDGGGMAAGVSSEVAQEFARSARPDFRQVIWAVCGERSQPGIAIEIQEQLGLPIDRVDHAAIERVLEEYRVLLVLDDAAGAAPPLTLREGSRGAIVISNGTAAPASPAAAESPLWTALGSCRKQAADLSIAARIAQMPPEEAVREAARLTAAGLLTPLDTSGTLFRLRAQPDGGLRRRHAEVLHDLISSRPALLSPSLLAEAERAWTWARFSDWQLASAFGEALSRLLQSHHRNAELAPLLTELHQEAQRHDDHRVADFCANELSWLGLSPLAPHRSPDATQLTLPLAG